MADLCQRFQVCRRLALTLINGAFIGLKTWGPIKEKAGMSCINLFEGTRLTLFTQYSAKPATQSSFSSF